MRIKQRLWSIWKFTSSIFTWKTFWMVIIIFYFFFCSSISSRLSSLIIFCSKLVVLRKPASSIAASIFLSYPVIIATQTSTNIIQRIFLNIPFGLLAHARFLISFWPNRAIAKSITASQRVYETSAAKPKRKPAGRIIARISA